jgi:hypothetical protein
VLDLRQFVEEAVEEEARESESPDREVRFDPTFIVLLLSALAAIVRICKDLNFQKASRPSLVDRARFRMLMIDHMQGHRGSRFGYRAVLRRASRLTLEQFEALKREAEGYSPPLEAGSGPEASGERADSKVDSETDSEVDSEVNSEVDSEPGLQDDGWEFPTDEDV